MTSFSSSTSTPSNRSTQPIGSVIFDSGTSRKKSSTHSSHPQATANSKKSTDTPTNILSDNNAHSEAKSTPSKKQLPISTRPSTSSDTSSAASTVPSKPTDTGKTNTSASPGYRPLNVKDALAYLDQVKVRFADRPDVYNRFLDIMKDFKHQLIDTPGVIERVSTLFQGNPELISGFNTFLPIGYHIECFTDPHDPDLIRVTTPNGIITTTTTKRHYPLVTTPSAMDQPPPMMATPIYYGPPYVHPQALPFSTTSHDQQLQQMHYAPPHPFYQYELHPSFSAQQYQNHLPPPPPHQHQHQLPLPPHQYSQYPYYHQQQQQKPEPQQQQQQQQPLSKQHPPLQNVVTNTEKTPQQNLPQAKSPDNMQQMASRVSQPSNQSPSSTKRPTLDFNNAINYVNKIKNRFADDPDSYKQFLEVLQTYQKEEKKIEDVYSHVKELFYGHGDLLDEFQQFLPEVGELHGNNKRAFSNTGMSSYMSNGKKRRGAYKKHKQGLDVPSADGDYNDYADHWYLKRGDYGTRQGFDPNNPTVSSEEVELFEHIRKHIGNKPSYEVFLKLLNLYSQDIIDLDILMERAYPFLGSKPELYDWFKSVVGYIPNIESTSIGGAGGDGALVMNKILKPDLVRCDTVPESPSYRLVPKDWQHQSCSGRDSLCWEVLNDTYVSHPIWASEESGFVSSKKNPYEEAMHRCEEERYDYDLNIDANLNSIALLEPIVANLKTMSLEEQELFTLSPGLGGVSTSIYERIIKKIYGVERGAEVIQLLYSDPAHVAPVVMKRLKQKDEEWTKGQRDWNKVWREIDEKNYYKSFDYQGLTFKTSERKTLTTRYLLNEIESMYHHDDTDDDIDKNGRGTDSPSTTRKTKSKSLSSQAMQTEHGNYLRFMYTFGDTSIFKDISLLILSYMEHQNGFSKADCDKIRQFIQNFIPSFFLVDDVIPTGFKGASSSAAATNGEHYSHFERCKNQDTGKNGSIDSNENDDDCDDDDTTSTSTPSDDLSDADRPYSQQSKGDNKNKQQPELQPASRSSSRLRIATTSNSSQEQSTDKENRIDSQSDDNESNLEQQSQPSTATDEPSNNSNPSSQQANNNTSSLSPSPSHVSEGADSSLESSLDVEIQMQLQHLISAATLTIPKFYKRDVNSLFGNAHLYCFLRLFEILYSRLFKMKQIDKKMQLHPKCDQFNSTALKLGLKGNRFDDVDTTQGYYKTLLEQTDRLFSSNVDSAMYEEIIRYLFKTDAYVFFTVDKLVHAIVKQIQTLVSDEKSMDLILLYQDNQRKSDSATYQPLFGYHNQAEDTIGETEHLFKLDFNIVKKQLSIHLLGQDEKLDDENLRHENHLANFMNWTKSEKVTQKRMMAYLKRNIPSGFKSLETMVAENNLHYCIRHGTYQLGFTPGSEDMLYRPATPLSSKKNSIKTDTEATTQDLVIGKDRKQAH